MAMSGVTMLVMVAALTVQQVPPPTDTSALPATSVDDIEVVGNVLYGTVELECEARPNGSLANCVILSETPAGYGFGQAALNGAERARLSPAARRNMARDAKVRFTTRFRLQR